MILTQEQVEKRLASEKNIANKAEELRQQPEIIIRDGKNHQGRLGSKDLTENERVAIGTIASLMGNEAASELMGVSERTASHLRTGQMTAIDSTGTRRFAHDASLQAKIQERLDSSKLTIQERAAEKLLKSMGLIDDDKLANCNARELANVSNQMSQVMRNMSNTNRDNNKQGGVKIVLHPPRTAKEDSFDVIEIGVG